MTVIILFKRKDKSYRMRLPRIHLHPGDRDRFEVASKDMLGQVSWSLVPDGSHDVPSGEWLVRRALWHVIEGDPPWAVTEPDFTTIDLGEI